MEVWERENKKKWLDKIFEDIIAENFPNVRKETLTEVQKV